MPIYEYEARNKSSSCPRCTCPFECLQRMADPPLDKCPDCGAPVSRIISRPAVGGSKSSLDRRAKAAGFTKLRRLGKGEYEKQY